MRACAQVAAEAQAREAEAAVEGQPRKRGGAARWAAKARCAILIHQPALQALPSASRLLTDYGWRVQPRPEEVMSPAGTPQEAFQRMVHHKKLSSKINYQNLDDLFSG